MKRTYYHVALMILATVFPASAQIMKSATECEKVLGKPMKIHQSSPPSRLYLHDGLHVQVSFEGGKATSVIYRLVGPTGAQKLSEARVKKIYAQNGIQQKDVVPIDFPEFEQLRGFYKQTKDKKSIILNDRTKNVFVIYDAKALLRQLRKGR